MHFGLRLLRNVAPRIGQLAPRPITAWLASGRPSFGMLGMSQAVSVGFDNDRFQLSLHGQPLLFGQGENAHALTKLRTHEE